MFNFNEASAPIIPDNLRPTPRNLIENIPTQRIPHSYGKELISMVGAAEQLLQYGAPNYLIKKLFDENGKFKYVDRSDTDFCDMESENAYDYLLEKLEPVFRAISLFLDEPTSKRRPYNDHSETHVEFVKNKSIEIYESFLERGGNPELSKKQDLTVLSIASAVHDIGYFLDPDNHPETSIILLEKIFPQLQFTRDNEVLEKVKLLVKYHEGDEFRKLIKEKNLRSYQEILNYLENEPLLCAFSLADKLDQRIERVRDDSILNLKAENAGAEPEKFVADGHIEINLFTQISGSGFDELSEDYLVSYLFDQAPKLPSNFDRYMRARSSDPSKYKLSVSELTHDLSRKRGISYFDSLVNRNLEYGATKMVRMGLYGLALFDSSRAFVHRFEDVERGISREFVFRREYIDEDIENFWNLVPPESRKKRIGNELKI